MAKNKINTKIKLLVIVYIAFISLGLPDGILGVAWPNMRKELELPLEVMGVLTITLLFNSAFSSVMSSYVEEKIGISKIVFISCLMTGIGLLGYSFSSNFFYLIFFTIPLGLGQGAVDSVLNNFVAEHYSSKHMNWLHCFWGVGASLGPFVMTTCIAYFNTWRTGYIMIAGMQLFLALMLLISLCSGIWKVNLDSNKTKTEKSNDIYKLSGKFEQGCAVSQFFLYTGIEFSMSAWISSVLVELKGIPISSAGFIASAYYAAIMIGRFISGIIVNKFGNMKMIRIGFGLAFLGGLILILTSNSYIFNLAGTLVFGLGLAPLYPCLMNETPKRFKKNISRRLIGYQVGAACLGGSIVSSGIGVFLAKCSLKGLFPILIILLILYFVLNEYLHNRLKKSKAFIINP